MLPLTADFKPLDRPRQLERLEACEQMPEDRLDLDAREVRAHADVLAETEREVRVRAAIDAERERIVEHVFVAVRRREVERELVAGARSSTPRTSQSSVATRVKWLIGLTQRRISSTASGQQLGVGAQLLPLGRGARRTRAGRR